MRKWANNAVGPLLSVLLVTQLSILNIVES